MHSDASRLKTSHDTPYRVEIRGLLPWGNNLQTLKRPQKRAGPNKSIFPAITMPSDLNKNRQPNDSCSAVKALATRISREAAKMGHCAVYEDELQRIWPLKQKDRESKIAHFAKDYDFRLRHYKKGLCAIFDKELKRRAS